MGSCVSQVLALDSVYHFASKRAFFGDAAKLLRPGGKVAVTDMALVRADIPLWLRLALTAMNIPSCNLWTEQEYTAHLAALGFKDAVIEPLDGVLEAWFPRAFLQHIRYVVVTASVASSAQVREKVAVIGSGLAGLAAAHSLCGERDVTIFEGNERLGLEGHATKLGSATVDIPLRMSNRGYYLTVARSVG